MSVPSTMPPGKPMPNFAASTPQSSVWDRITTWASENKAVVYTIAGVAVVVSGAGVAYYLLDSVSSILPLVFVDTSSLQMLMHNYRRTPHLPKACQRSQRKRGEGRRKKRRKPI